MVWILLIVPLVCCGQTETGRGRGLDSLAKLRGTTEYIQNLITKQDQHGLPVTIRAVEHTPFAVRIDLTVSHTNDFVDISDAYVFVNVRQDAFWIPLSPIRKTVRDSVYRLNLPRSLAGRSCIVLACGRDTSQSFPEENFWVLFRQLYRTTYTVDLGSYCRQDAKATSGDTRENAAGDDINVVIE